MRRERKVLIGEISSYKAIVISRFIKTYYADIIVYTYDTKKYSKYIVSKHSDRNFYINPDKFEEELLALVLDYEIDFFFPVINHSLSKLWQNKNLFNGALDYLGDFEKYNILNDKNLLQSLAKKLGLKTPETFRNLKDAIIPYVVKPTNLSSAKGVVYVKKVDDIPRNLTYNPIIQKYIKGVGVGYSFYCKNGEILNGYGHKRISEYPVFGGSSTYREEYVNSEIIAIAEKIVQHLEYTGFAMFEYKLTSVGEVYLIEVNPRIWGSVNQGLVNGLNYFEGILGKPSRSMVEKKINTYLAPLIYLSFIKYILRFQFSPVFIFVKNIFNNSPDVSIYRDPKGYLSLLFRKFL